jgi:site-specific recombinase XerC
MGMKPRARRDRIGQAIDEYLAVQKRRGIGVGSLAAYNRVLGDFHAYAREQGCSGPEDVSPELVRGFHDMLLASGRATGTAHNAERVVSGFLKRLVEWERVEADPLAELFGGRQPGNKRMIAEELREVEATGVRMSIPGMAAAGHKTLLHRAVRIYGTWGKACAAAGVKRVPPGRPGS